MLPRTADLPAAFIVWLCSREAKFLKNKFVWANWPVDELKSRSELIQKLPNLEFGLIGWPKLMDTLP